MGANVLSAAITPQKLWGSNNHICESDVKTINALILQTEENHFYV